MDDEATLLERKQAIYKCLDEKYVIHGQKYKGQQYSQIYFARLRHLSNLLKPLVATWKPHLPVNTVLKLEESKECVIIGTIYKHMKLKPSVLDEYSKEFNRSAVSLVKPHNFVHPDDHLILEDEIGRVKLRGISLIPADFVTGIGLALHGKKTSDGDFFVENFLEVGLSQQIKVPACLGITKWENVYMLEFLTTEDQLKLIEPIKELDILLMQLAAAVPLDIMPGPTDPANFFLPQQPLHKCLFPGASSYNTFFSCTNPHQFELDSFLFLGTSGQNINDLDKYSSAKSKLEFVERTLRWRHLAPTTPNTLGCYPFTEQDPFFIENCPNVFTLWEIRTSMKHIY